MAMLHPVSQTRNPGVLSFWLPCSDDPSSVPLNCIQSSATSPRVRCHSFLAKATTISHPTTAITPQLVSLLTFLQSICHTEATMIFLKCHFVPFTSLLKALQWFPIRLGIKLKFFMMAYKTLQDPRLMHEKLYAPVSYLFLPHSSQSSPTILPTNRTCPHLRAFAYPVSCAYKAFPPATHVTSLF